MKRTIIFTLLSLALYLPIAAQDVRFGALAGVNVHTANYLDAKMGFSIGAKAELGFKSLAEGWYADASLLFESHPWQVKFDGLGTNLYKTFTEHASPWYLMLPIHVGYKFPVSQDVKLLVNGGPYVGMGLFGKLKYEMVKLDDKTEEGTTYDNVFTAKDGFGNKVQNRFAWGAGVRVGLEVKDKYQFILGYDRGFNQFYSNFGNSRMGLYSLSFAYMF